MMFNQFYFSFLVEKKSSKTNYILFTKLKNVWWKKKKNYQHKENKKNLFSICQFNVLLTTKQYCWRVIKGTKFNQFIFVEINMYEIQEPMNTEKWRNKKVFIMFAPFMKKHLRIYEFMKRNEKVLFIFRMIN